MRYALTFMEEDDGYEPSWSKVDTIIVDGKKGWYEDEEAVARVIAKYGVEPDSVEHIMTYDRWFIRNVEDIDVWELGDKK